MSVAPVKDKYSINGLTYTKMGLVALFSWLLWGDFCFTLMELVRPRILPLFLMGDAHQIGASATITNLMMVVVPGITGILIGPAVSFKSDRYRSKHGRRIPFIVWTMPFIVIALVGMGFGPQYRAFFEKIGGFLWLSPTNVTILLVGIFVVMFHAMDEFVNSVFWYLFADVVPEAFLGRFVAMMRIVGTGAGALFMWKVFPYAETHMHVIFLGAGLLYLGGFSLMCWRVKEGTYPPPDDLGEKPSIIKQIKVYLTECFSHRIYLLMFAYTACLAFSLGVNAFGIIFHRDGIDLSLKNLGAVGAVVGLATMALAFPSGWAVDKFHPLRITMFMKVPVIALQFFAFFYLRDLNTYIILEGAKMVFFGLQSAATYPLHVMIFPKDKFGQFASCNGMMKSTAMMVGGMAAAAFMDHMTDYGANKFEFRWLYPWIAGFQLLGLFCLIAMYGIWKKHGGDKNYVPPGSAIEKEMLAAAAAAAGEATDSAVNGNDAAE